MFLSLNHQNLEVYKASQLFVSECYKITKTFPPEEKYSLIPQIRRAALSVHLNIAEGCSRKSVTERKRFYEIARGSVVEVDAALDVAGSLNYLQNSFMDSLQGSMVNCFKLLSGML